MKKAATIAIIAIALASPAQASTEEAIKHAREGRAAVEAANRTLRTTGNVAESCS